MECRDLKDLISAVIDNEASPVDANAEREHLTACARCRALERRMRAVGDGVARVEGTSSPGFRDALFARMEAEELIPRRRSLFLFSLRWAAIPLGAAAAIALFLFVSGERGKETAMAPVQLPKVAQSPAASPAGPGAKEAAPARPALEREQRQPAAVASQENLSPEDREIIANLDLLEDPSALDSTGGDIDEMDMFIPSGRRQG